MQDHPSPPATPPAPDSLTHPDAAAPPARVAVTATIQSVITDAADLITRPEPGEAEARVADRLPEELAEAAAMLRALPARPAAMSGHDYALLAAVRTAHQAHEDVAETIARALARLAAELGSSAAVLRNRPGSWEASHVRDLLRGTIGKDGEGLDMYRGTGRPWRLAVTPGDPVAGLLDRLHADHPGWEIHTHPLGLGLWTAEHRSEDGRSIHFVVCHSGPELAARLDDLDRQAAQ